MFAQKTNQPGLRTHNDVANRRSHPQPAVSHKRIGVNTCATWQSRPTSRSMALTNNDLPKTEQEREARKHLKALEKQLRPKAKIRITGTISAGVIIRFGRLQYPIEREMASMEFSYDMEAKKMVRVPIMPTKG